MRKIQPHKDNQSGDYCRNPEFYFFLFFLNSVCFQDSYIKLCISFPRLEGIYWRALAFPSLEKITVQLCPNLMKLPLNSNTATESLNQIEGSSSWWEGLKWEGESLRVHFESILHISGPLIWIWIRMEWWSEGDNGGVACHLILPPQVFCFPFLLQGVPEIQANYSNSLHCFLAF